MQESIVGARCRDSHGYVLEGSHVDQGVASLADLVLGVEAAAVLELLHALVDRGVVLGELGAGVLGLHRLRLREGGVPQGGQRREVHVEAYRGLVLERALVQLELPRRLLRVRPVLDRHGVWHGELHRVRRRLVRLSVRPVREYGGRRHVEIASDVTQVCRRWGAAERS